MVEEKLLTIREVSALLGASEKEVIELAEKGTLPAYKVGGVYLRFKRTQVEEFRRTFKPLSLKAEKEEEYSFRERLRDFFYFNDFYILCGLIILLILGVIFRGY